MPKWQAHYGAIIAPLLMIYCSAANAYVVSCSNNGESPYMTGLQVNGSTNITLAANSVSPVDSFVGVALQVSNAAVSVVETWYQPPYTETCRECNGQSCWDQTYQRGGYSYTVQTNRYPRGTAAIKQNGATVSSVAITGSTAEVTTPPVQYVGQLTFIAEFTPESGSGYSAAISNAVMLTSNLNPAAAAAVIGVMRSE